MAEMQDEFDCSDYPEYHFLHNKKNKKVLGKFKDEMCGNIIYENVTGHGPSASARRLQDSGELHSSTKRDSSFPHSTPGAVPSIPMCI